MLLDFFQPVKRKTRPVFQQGDYCFCFFIVFFLILNFTFCFKNFLATRTAEFFCFMNSRLKKRRPRHPDINPRFIGAEITFGAIWAALAHFQGFMGMPFFFCSGVVLFSISSLVFSLLWLFPI